MKTSYFGKKCKGNTVAICRYPPSWWTGRVFKELAPSAKLLSDYIGKGIAEEVFGLRYYEETLSRLDPKAIFDELGEDSILLCYEKPGNFCHRRLVADWLERNLDIKVNEVC